MCYCKPCFDIRCVCDPTDESFTRCPERHRWIYFTIGNEVELYKAVEGGEGIKEAVTQWFQNKGYEIPGYVEWECIKEWREEDNSSDS